MAIIPVELDRTYRSIVTLEYYSSLVGYSECAMFGVFNPDTHIQDECRDIWTLPQRNYMLRYFAEAQEEIENEIGFLLQPTWISENSNNARLSDIQTYRRGTYYTKWNNVLTLGKKVTTILGEYITVDYTNDPAEIIVTGLDPEIIYDIQFIKIFLPDSQIEINPSAIEYLPGDTELTILIPRCRLVKKELRDNSPSGLRYDVLDNFTEELNVYYWTTVNEDSLEIISSDSQCATSSDTECLAFVTKGLTTVKADTFCNFLNYGCCDKRNIYSKLYYLAGEIIPTEQQFDMVMRLAHSKMPDEPCGCEIAQSLWKRDRNIPDFLTRERLNNPFGISDGAMVVHQWCKQMKKLRIGHN